MLELPRTTRTSHRVGMVVDEEEEPKAYCSQTVCVLNKKNRVLDKGEVAT